MPRVNVRQRPPRPADVPYDALAHFGEQVELARTRINAYLGAPGKRHRIAPKNRAHAMAFVTRAQAYADALALLTGKPYWKSQHEELYRLRHALDQHVVVRGPREALVP